MAWEVHSINQSINQSLNQSIKTRLYSNISATALFDTILLEEEQEEDFA